MTTLSKTVCISLRDEAKTHLRMLSGIAKNLCEKLVEYKNSHVSVCLKDLLNVAVMKKEYIFLPNSAKVEMAMMVSSDNDSIVNGTDIPLYISKNDIRIHEDKIFISAKNRLCLTYEPVRFMKEIKTLVIYPPHDDTCEIMLVYEPKDMVGDGHRHYQIYTGIDRLMTCYDSKTHEMFYIGESFGKGLAILFDQSKEDEYKTERDVFIEEFIEKSVEELLNMCKENGIKNIGIDYISRNKFANDYSMISLYIDTLPYDMLFKKLIEKTTKEGITLKFVDVFSGGEICFFYNSEDYNSDFDNPIVYVNEIIADHSMHKLTLIDICQSK